MDQHRFDSIVKRVAAGGSRRGALRLLAGGALAPVLARVGLAGAGAAPGPAPAECQNLGRTCEVGGRRCCGNSICKNGRCRCESDKKRCKGRCIRRNKCCRDRDCGPGSACQAGVCTCPAGKTACGGACVDTATDSANCGSCGRVCQGRDTCGGGGTPGVCGCTRATCASLGKNCGSVSDGCGGTLECGACEGRQTCGGGGTPNLCGCLANGTVTNNRNLCCSDSCCADFDVPQGQCRCAGGCG